MQLTHENYYSSEADWEYLSVSQYHNFWGTDVYEGCQAKALAKLKGEWTEKPSNAMLVGSYVDEYFSGDLARFKADNPDIFTMKGELKADFKKAEEIIKAAESDEIFSYFVKGAGVQQMIVNGTIDGVKWKGKLDNLYPGICIVDLKVIASIHDKVWSDWRKEKVDFIVAGGYLDQGAVYQELYFQMTGEKLPFYIAAITKEEYPDKEVIEIPDYLLEKALDEIKSRQNAIIDIKNSIVQPIRCGKCAYCRSRKKLTGVISYTDGL